MNSSKAHSRGRAQRGRVRIIGGRWRSRLVEFPSREGLRPTPDRVRETLFNWLGQDLDGMSCLDLFAGSGALGFEAASRGAVRVVMIERDPASVAALQENRVRLGADAVEIVRGEALAWIDATDRRFDVVFLDPPFRQNLLPAALARLSQRLAEGGRVYAEADHAVEEPGWRVLKHARAGQVHYQLLQRD